MDPHKMVVENELHKCLESKRSCIITETKFNSIVNHLKYPTEKCDSNLRFCSIKHSLYSMQADCSCPSDFTLA